MWNLWNSRSGQSLGSKSSRTSRSSSRSSHNVSLLNLASGASSRAGGSRSQSIHRELEFSFFIRQTESLYPPWWTRESVIQWYQDLPDDTLWNCYICACVLVGVVWTVAELQGIYVDILDVIYNISYAIHVAAIGYKIVTELENNDITFWIVLGFLVDLGSFAHYVKDYSPMFKLICYYVRLHRPFKYLWSLNDYNLKGSILGTALKYCYIFMVMRITWAYIWLYVDVVGNLYTNTKIPRNDSTYNETPATKFLSAVYLINKMFIPIGPSEFPDTDLERVICLLIMLTGCLVVTGAAVASLSLVISLYMRPEETFRSRYRLIMKEMKDTQVPASLREKVETFYKMYWHKQRAVSQTQLLPTFPPTLPATIDTDIYFEATQKARILRELSYQILAELAKEMETVHYIPGDAIIKRGSKKCKIIYITYGDVEMLTAEDDTTAILRMTRGTVLTPCGCAAAQAVGVSHLAVRAATFCTAHVLTAASLWRVVNKHSVTQDHAGPILASFTDHIEKVKRHYQFKIPDNAIHKSSILNFNRNLLVLKNKKDEEGKSILGNADVFLEIAGCYIIRNRPDTTLTEQSDEICLRPIFPCILQPSSSLLVAWHAFVAMLILIICITHPYHLVYKKIVSLGFRFFDYCMTAVFIVDHIVHLSTGANVEEGVPITFAQTSSQQMRSHWFVLDVLATLPIFEFVGTGHFAGINKVLRLPKLFRVLKGMEESCEYHRNVLRFMSYTLLLLIACYLIAAMQQGFMCFQSGYCLVTNFTHRPFWEQKPLDDDTVQARLMFGLYWSISMINFSRAFRFLSFCLVHRETWGKENWKNVIYTLVILEICIVLRIFMEAVYSATIMVTTALRENYGARIAMVKSFLIRNEMDPILRKRFITYLELCWYTDKAYKMTHKKHSNIFYDLPAHVYQDIVGRNRSKYILELPFMRLLKKDDLRAVSSVAKMFYTSPNEILLNTGDLSNEICIIKRGFCEILDPVTQNRIGILRAKNHFGGLICLLRLPAYYTIRAITHVQVISIPRKHLTKVFENSQLQHALEYCRTVPEYTKAQTKMPSFIKYVPPPPTPNTMHFRLPRKHEPDSEFLNPFNRLGFLSILRYVFPRSTIRPDGKYLLRYEWFRVTCALCSAQLFPHYTYLVLQWPYLYYLAVFLDMSAYFDIVQRMLIGYYNADGILVYHPSSTAAYYMKRAFLVDLISCLSLENLESARKDTFENKLHVTPTEQYLMLNRLIQLYRLPSAMNVLKEYIERQDIILVFQAIPLFMAMLNVLTCFMVFYSVSIFYSVDNEGKYEWFIEPVEDRGGSWLYLFRDTFRFNLTSTPWNMHLATYFWVVYECSTTGYGVFNPSNSSIMQVLFVGIASCAMIITYFSVRIISIRANVNKSLAGFHQHMKDINVYLAREKLTGELQKEIRRFYEYNWEKMGGIDYRGVLKLCDQITLRTDAILHIYGPTFAKCPILANADVSLLRILGRAVRGVYFLRDMKILEQNDMVTDIYFVDYGGVEVRVNIGDNVHIIRLPRGSVFGNMEGTASHRSPYNVVATGRLHVLLINSLIFSRITKDFPAMKELMDKSKTGVGKDNKMYILGGDATVKIRRAAAMSSGPPPRRKSSILKYIYFQEGLIQIYLIIICMGCIYLDMFNAGYQNNTMWMLTTLYSLDFCFFLKIFTQHSLPFLVPNKNIKKLMLPIRQMYFKGEFRYDFISVVPVELLSFAVTEVNASWMVFSWMRLNRTFRIATVHKCLRRRQEDITANLTLTTILAVFIWFTLFVHATSCIWFFIGMMEDSIQPNSSWMHIDGGETHCDNNYICSIYFVITTFTQNGVGDIMPKKQSEVLFVAMLMILATMIFMVYVGELSNIIQFQSYRSFSFYSKYLELQEFLTNNRVSNHLVNIVNKYTLHLWRENRGLQIPHFLNQAPLSLRLRVMSAAYLHHITRHHIFEECEAAFLRQLVGCLKLYTYNEGMYVVKESEITDSMYVIHTGKVKETCEEMDILSARVYPAGSYFGILQGLIRNTPYTHSYETMIKSQVLTLKLDDWEYLLKHFPDSRDAIHKHMRQIGDDDVDKSNWPGGAPVEPTIPELFPLSTITDIPLESQFPGLEGRPFGRDSGQDEAPILPASSLRRPSLHFPWPSARDKEAQTKEEEQHEAVEELPKTGFFDKISKTAKKLMGRVSDPEVLAALSGEGKDELLLEEDEEATEALLAQFEAAKKMAEKDSKKSKVRRKSMFIRQDEEEKQLIALDIESSTEVRRNESKPFAMQPLRIRDSETEILPHETSTARDVLNLGRTKSRMKQDSSKILETINLGRTKSADTSETIKETELTQTLLGTTGFIPDKETLKVKTDEKIDAHKTPTTIQESSKIQVTIDMTKTESVVTTDTSEETALTETLLGTTDSKTDEDTIKNKKNDMFKPTMAQESSEIQVVIDMMKTESDDTVATTEDMIETQTTLGKIDSKRDENATYMKHGVKTTDSIADENTIQTHSIKESKDTKTAVKTIDSKAPQETQKSHPGEITESLLATEDTKPTEENTITKALNLLYPELETTAGTNLAARADQVTQDTEYIQEDRAFKESKGVTLPEISQPSPEDTQSTSTTRDTPGTSTARDTTDTHDTTDTKDFREIQNTQSSREAKDSKVFKRTILPEVFYPGPVQNTHTQQQVTWDTKKTESAQFTTDVQSATDVKDGQEATGTQTAPDIQVVRPTQESTGVQASKDNEDAQTSTETTGTQEAPDIKEIHPVQGTTGTKSTQATQEAQPEEETSVDSNKVPSVTASNGKLILFLSDTSITEDSDHNTSQTMVLHTNPPPATSFQEEAARKKSFTKIPIIYDPYKVTTVPSDNEVAAVGSSLHSIQSPTTSVSDAKLPQHLSEAKDIPKDTIKDVPKDTVKVTDDDKVSSSKATDKPPGKPKEDAYENDKESTPDVELKEEGTRTSISKLNRRFVRVRYEENKSQHDVLIEDQEDVETNTTEDTHLNIFTMDSDEPQPEEDVESNKSDDQIATSTSGVYKPNNPNYRKSTD